MFIPMQKAFLHKIKLTFDEEGISIPYPQQDVHLFNETKG
jgi:small-conductance mechanosensitive channel